MAAGEVAGQPAASLSTDTASRLVKRSPWNAPAPPRSPLPPAPHASTHPAPSPGSPAPSPAASWVQCGGWVSGRGESASPPVASSVVWGPTQESRSTATRQSPCTASARGCRLGGPDRLSPRGAATARAPPARCPPPDLGWGWARVPQAVEAEQQGAEPSVGSVGSVSSSPARRQEPSVLFSRRPLRWEGTRPFQAQAAEAAEALSTERPILRRLALLRL